MIRYNIGLLLEGNLSDLSVEECLAYLDGERMRLARDEEALKAAWLHCVQRRQAVESAIISLRQSRRR